MPFLTILIFIFVLGVLIFIHELAHFVFAKRSGVRVDEFCIGFPPRIYKKQVGETLYSIGIIPIGGFNKIYGEDSRDADEGAFYGKSVWTRAKIIAAGPLSNFIFAAILFIVIFMLGAPQAIEGKAPEGATDVGVQVISTITDSPAKNAGVLAGDKILKIKILDSEKWTTIKEVKDVQSFTKNNSGDTVVLGIKRGEDLLEKEVLARANPPKGEGSMGIGLLKTARISYPWNEAIIKGVQNIFSVTIGSFIIFFEAIKGSFIGEPVPGVEVSGPIGIGNLFFQMATLGWIYVVQFTAILSLNLAILNILPFPALDGGRLIFLFIEKIKKSPVKIEIENRFNQVGFLILILFLIFITFKDIQKMF